MSAALLRKTASDAAVLAVLAGAAVLGFEALWVLAMANMADTLLDLWRQLEFVQRFLRIMFSIDVDTVTVNGLLSFGLVHPFLLAVTWGALIASGTRALAGEIERGTADLLLTLPCARRGVYATVSIVSLASAALFSALAYLGLVLGTALVELREPPDRRAFAIVAVNLFALLAAVGSATLLVSAIATRRGVAVGVIVSVLLFSFLINFLETLLPAVAPLRFLGFLNYYRPVEIVRGGAWPIADISILIALAACAWLVGLAHFVRRDIPAP